MSEPALNRHQRRAQKITAKKRADKMDQSRFHAYQSRARMWSKGHKLVGRHIGGEFEAEWHFTGFIKASRKQAITDYATRAPMRWHVTAYCVCKADDDSRYISERSAKCGQAATPGELMELRNELMQWARDDVNARHIWDEYFEMECLG